MTFDICIFYKPAHIEHYVSEIKAKNTEILDNTILISMSFSIISCYIHIFLFDLETKLIEKNNLLLFSSSSMLYVSPQFLNVNVELF